MDNRENATVTRKADIDSYSPLEIIECLPHNKTSSMIPPQ